MSWLQINSPRWTHELQRWLLPGDVVEVSGDRAVQFAYHTDNLPASPGHDAPEDATVTLHARRNLYLSGEAFVMKGQEFTVSGARAREIPTLITEVVSMDLPRPLPEMVTRPAPVSDEGGAAPSRSRRSKSK